MEEESKSVKIDKWDGSALKNALDDHVKKILKENLGYVESYKLMDIRLFLCTISVCFAAFAFVWDWIYPYPKSRDVMIVCVLAYFVMMLVLTLYMTYYEMGCFMLALEKDKAGFDPDNVWRISSKIKRFDDKYELDMVMTNGLTKAKCQASFIKSVCEFFDEDGNLCEDEFNAEVLKLHGEVVKAEKID